MLGLRFQGFAEGFDAVETFGDVFHRTGVAQPHVGVGAERDAGDAGDLLLFEQFGAETLRAETEVGNVRQHVKRAHGFDAGDAARLG